MFTMMMMIANINSELTAHFYLCYLTLIFTRNWYYFPVTLHIVKISLKEIKLINVI